MKKRMISLFLATALLLCGCTGELQQDPMESTPPTEQTVDYWAKVKAIAEQVPAYEGEPLIEYDPDREVYISLPTQGGDFYHGGYSGGILIHIFTREHYDIEQIQVNLPIQNEYRVEVKDFTDFTRLDSDQESWQIQYYQYLCLQGVDWQALAQQEAYARAAITLKFQGNKEHTPINVEANQAYTAIIEECRSAYNALLPQYNALKVGDVPEFSYYWAEVSFFPGEEAVDEAFENIDVVIDGKTYPQKVEEIRLHKEYAPELLPWVEIDDREGIKIDSVRFGVICETPYQDGYASYPEVFNFTALGDLTITGLRQFGTQVNILACQVKISGQPDYFWDMTRPIEVEAGDDVVINLYFQDDLFQQYEVSIQNYRLLDYEIRGKAHCLVNQWELFRLNDQWDTYLMAFEGYDIGAYYEIYYERNMHDWTDEILPELLGK